MELFEAVDHTIYFTAQWYYRAQDTVSPLLIFWWSTFGLICLILNLFCFQVIKNVSNLIDTKRVFFSEIRDDNPLDCLVEKLHIARLPLNV